MALLTLGLQSCSSSSGENWISRSTSPTCAPAPAPASSQSAGINSKTCGVSPRPLKPCRLFTITYETGNAIAVSPVFRSTDDYLAPRNTAANVAVFNIQDFQHTPEELASLRIVPLPDQNENQSQDQTAIPQRSALPLPAGLLLHDKFFGRALQPHIIVVWLYDTQSFDDHMLLAIMQHEFAADLQRAEMQPKDFDTLHLKSLGDDIAMMVSFQIYGQLTLEKFPEVRIPLVDNLPVSPDVFVAPEVDAALVGTRAVVECWACERMFELPLAIHRHQAVCEILKKENEEWRKEWLEERDIPDGSGDYQRADGVIVNR